MKPLPSCHAHHSCVSRLHRHIPRVRFSYSDVQSARFAHVGCRTLVTPPDALVIHGRTLRRCCLRSFHLCNYLPANAFPASCAKWQLPLQRLLSQLHVAEKAGPFCRSRLSGNFRCGEASCRSANKSRSTKRLSPYGQYPVHFTVMTETLFHFVPAVFTA